MKKLLLIVFLFLIFNSSFVYADSVKPSDHIATLSEKIGEKINLYSKFTNESKAEYKLFLVNKRLSELLYAFKDDPDLIEIASSRYTTYVQDYMNFVTENGVSSVKKKSIDTLSQNVKTLETQQTKLKYESGWWLSNQNNINSTKDSIAKIKTL